MSSIKSLIRKSDAHLREQARKAQPQAAPEPVEPEIPLTADVSHTRGRRPRDRPRGSWGGTNRKAATASTNARGLGNKRRDAPLDPRKRIGR